MLGLRPHDWHCRYGTPGFDQARARLLDRGRSDFEAVEPQVRQVLSEVRRGGDEAVVQFVEQFEERKPEPLFRREYDGLGRSLASPAMSPALSSSPRRASRVTTSTRRHRDFVTKKRG